MQTLIELFAKLKRADSTCAECGLPFPRPAGYQGETPRCLRCRVEQQLARSSWRAHATSNE